MIIYPDYKNMKPKKYPTVEDVMTDKNDNNLFQIKEMTPEQMLKLADAMENRTFKGHINLAMSWEDTIKDLRRQAYELLKENREEEEH